MGQCRSPSVSPSRQAMSSTSLAQEEPSLFQQYLQEGNPFEMHTEHKEEETEDVLASNGVSLKKRLLPTCFKSSLIQINSLELFVFLSNVRCLFILLSFLLWTSLIQSGCPLPPFRYTHLPKHVSLTRLLCEVLH